MKAKMLIITVIIIAEVIFLSACVKNHAENPVEMTLEQAGDIAQTYFEETYGISVTAKNVEYQIVGDSRYRNRIIVIDEETEYILYFDEKNQPLLDNVAAIETIKTIDPYSFEDKLQFLGLKLHAGHELKAIFGHLGMPFSVWFCVLTEDLPNKDANEGIYSLLAELKNEGVDKLYIDYAQDGLWINGVLIETDVSRAEFYMQYNDFVNSVH